MSRDQTAYLSKIGTFRVLPPDEGDLSPEAVRSISTELDVAEAEVVSMNRRLLGADQSLNTPLSEDGKSEWQDWLADDTDDQEVKLAARQELGERRRLL